MADPGRAQEGFEHKLTIGTLRDGTAKTPEIRGFGRRVDDV
jgi:hypothetical protein